MKSTLLDLTQRILSALSSDEVNSISDTAESMKVAEVIRTTFFNIVARTDLPEHRTLFKLTASNDADRPVLMYKPDPSYKIEWIKYLDTDQLYNNYKYVTILPNSEFLDTCNFLNPDEMGVEVFEFNAGGSSFNLRYRTDRTPSFCTVIKDYYVVFDAFDSALDSTLQENKTMCEGTIIPTFLMEDNFIPMLDDQQFPLLYNEAKALAFLEMKQTTHPKAEQESKRQWGTLQRTKALVTSPSYFDALPNFGRARNFRKW